VISALRPGRQSQKLKEVICTVERLCGSHKIGEVERWLFLDRVALTLFDYGRFSKAAEVVGASQQIFRGITTDPRNPQRLILDSANSARRRAVIEGLAGKLGDGLHIRYVIDQLVEHSQEFRARHQTSSFATTLDVASKIAKDVLHDSELSHRYSGIALEYRREIDHWWGLQEHLFREAEYYAEARDHSNTVENVVDALAINMRAPVILEPVPPDQDARRGDLRQFVYHQLDVNPFELVDRGVRLNELAATPLPISDAEIDRIVGCVVRNEN